MSALNTLRAGCVLLLAIAPWVVATGAFTPEKLDWQCDTPFEVLRLTAQGKEIRVFARLSQYYRPDGRGLERLNGREETLIPDKPLQMRTFHRVAEFGYGQAGPYLKKRIDKVSRGMGDTMPANWAL